jgi:hypothetical protein
VKLPIIEALKTVQTNERTPIAPRYVTYQADYKNAISPEHFDCFVTLETTAIFAMDQKVSEQAINQSRGDVLAMANDRAKQAIAHEIYGPVIERLFAIQRNCWERGDELAGEDVGQLIRDLRL